MMNYLCENARYYSRCRDSILGMCLNVTATVIVQEHSVSVSVTVSCMYIGHATCTCQPGDRAHVPPGFVVRSQDV